MNAKVVLVAAILCSAFLLSSATLSNIVAKFENPKNKDFDYFLLALSWPGSICRSLHPCHIPAGQTDNFTMHGLWPDNFDGSYPQDCDSPAGKFDPAQIQSLLPDLNKYWTDFKNDAPSKFDLAKKLIISRFLGSRMGQTRNVRKRSPIC
jgi:ribonuclease T2